MNNETIFSTENNIHADVYYKYPISISRGKDAKLWDSNGKEYLDFMGGYGVSVVGYNNAYVVEAIKRQSEQLITCHSSLYNDARANFLENILKISPPGLERIYIGNSGAEAVECAIKLARKYTGRKEIISMIGSFHGKTMGALSLTWNPKYRNPFEPLLSDVKFIPFGDTKKAMDAISEKTAAIIVEPVQGETGIHPAPDSYLSDLRQITEKNGSLLIFDEIQSGFGRTGKIWAHEHWGVIPDIMCTAKGIGGGLPLSCTIATNEVMSKFKLGDHTSTFGGNPLSCAAGSAAIQFLLDHELHKKAEKIGAYMKDGLQSLNKNHKVTREVRGLGLMLALDLRFDVRQIILSGLKKGIILLYSGRNILRFLPPLVITEDEVDHGLSILDGILTEEDRTRFG